MEIIISPDRVSSHKVAKYEFKNFDGSCAPTKEGSSFFVSAARNPVQTLAQVAGNFSSEENERLAAIDSKLSAEGDMVQTLVKRIEEFSDNVIKLQMRLEKQEDEFARKLADEKERSFNDGKKTGEESAKNELISQVQAQKDQLTESLSRLSGALNDFSAHAASLEKELSSVAVEIAAEVIAKEVSVSSSDIAKSLAAALLGEINGALKITIKVSPEDAKELQEMYKDDAKIEITADRAVQKGGVVITSDAGNVDAQIHNRFAAIKKSLLRGNDE